MGWFGPNKDDAWRELGREIGAEFFPDGFWRKKSKVRLCRNGWTITLDVYTRSNGEHSYPSTRVRAPFANLAGFRFSIHRRTFFTGLAEWLGMRDIEVGGSEFDQAFVVKGNDETRVRELFADRGEIRLLIEAQPWVQLSVNHEWLTPFQKIPQHVDVLKFQVPGVVKDVERLKGLFQLHFTVLERLAKIGVAKRDAVEAAA